MVATGGRGLWVALAMLWLGACAAPSSERFEQVRPGMTRDEVVALLGEPSGRFLVPVDESSDAVRVERWSWGDSLSTVATQQLFRDQPDPRVWSVLFDTDGRVVDVWVPQPEASARLRRLETTR